MIQMSKIKINYEIINYKKIFIILTAKNWTLSQNDNKKNFQSKN